MTVGGTVATRIINGTITQTGNVNPVGNTISSLGKPLFGYSDLHANAVYTPIGKLDDGVLVNTFDSVGNVSFGSWSVSDSVRRGVVRRERKRVVDRVWNRLGRSVWWVVYRVGS